MLLDREKHCEYITKELNQKNFLYYATKHTRLSTLYWAMNSLRMMGSPLFHQYREEVIHTVQKCLNPDGGFGGGVGYASSTVSTFAALQLLYIFGVSYYSDETVSFLVSLVDENDRAFTNTEHGEKDARVDCCGILSLRLLEIMKSRMQPGRQSGGGHSHNALEAVSGETSARGCEDISGHSRDKMPQAEPEDGASSLFVGEGAFDNRLLEQPISDSFIRQAGLDKEGIIRRLLLCYNPVGGFGQIPGSEPHAAHTFCCLTSLRSLGALGRIDSRATTDFLVYRQCQNGGLNGRVNKKEDVCYSFWTFASLRILGCSSHNCEMLREFIFSCEGPGGGFSDRSNHEPDLYHQMFAIGSLSLMGWDGLVPIDPGFAM